GQGGRHDGRPLAAGTRRAPGARGRQRGRPDDRVGRAAGREHRCDLGRGGAALARRLLGLPGVRLAPRASPPPRARPPPPPGPPPPGAATPKGAAAPAGARPAGAGMPQGGLVPAGGAPVPTGLPTVPLTPPGGAAVPGNEATAMVTGGEPTVLMGD